MLLCSKIMFLSRKKMREMYTKYPATSGDKPVI